jgi:hypothetical protein
MQLIPSSTAKPLGRTSEPNYRIRRLVRQQLRPSDQGFALNDKLHRLALQAANLFRN